MVVGLFVFINMDADSDLEIESIVTTETGVETEVASSIEGDTPSVMSVDANYVVVAEKSEINWSGKKPLIEGYINSGSLAVNKGDVLVSAGTATGEFEIDMNSLTVSETKAKPGKESLLESHLKGEGWFSVAEFPVATFEIIEATADVNGESNTYNVRGALTMKGQTHELTFPAEIYLNSDGQLQADATFEFDRTQWGITAGSGSFFDNLADNVVDDMVSLTFSLVAEKK